MTKVFTDIAVELDSSGLVWHPEIGDEIAYRTDLARISILVDPLGLRPKELREVFLWLPTMEQLVLQLEARQAMLFHAGLNELFDYEAVIKTSVGIIEASARTLRTALGKALLDMLAANEKASLH